MITYGKHTYGDPEVMWGQQADLTVGNFTCIAGGVKIFLGGNHMLDRLTIFPFGYTHDKQGNPEPFMKADGYINPMTNGSVVIGSDVWICTDATVMSGVTVGHGSVIACRCHVVKDVPPYAIVGGNPAKLIRYRFTEDQIDSMLQIRWWDWTDEKINENIPLLCSNNISAFIEKHRV